MMLMWRTYADRYKISANFNLTMDTVISIPGLRNFVGCSVNSVISQGSRNLSDNESCK